MPMADVVPVLREQAVKMAVMYFVLFGFIGSLIPSFNQIKKKILDLLYR